MLIKNYGLFWRAENVFWGRKNKEGTLLGIKSTNLSGSPVDFRDQAGVYILYADYEIVYIGQAGNKNQKLFERLRQHRRDALAGRWNQFSWFGTRKVIAKETALATEVTGAHSTHGEVLNHIEAILIYSAEPRHNRQGGKFGGSVVQYLQHRDENLGPTEEQMIHDLWSSNKTKL